MKGFATICKIELRLFTRDFFSFFFALVFPVLMLFLFGGIYGNTPIYEGADVKMMDVSVPAYSVMVIGVVGLMSLPLTLSGYKEKRIYKRFDATPVGKKSIIAAQVFINFMMTLIGILILLIAGTFFYHIQIKGDFLSICAGVLFSIATYFIMLFLSGATMPDMLFPDTIKRISGFLPMTYAVDLMQGVFAGDSLSLHGKELLILGLVAAVGSVIGAILYRRKDWT